MKPIRGILITGHTVWLLSVLAGSLLAIADSSASPLFGSAFLSFDTGASPYSVAIGDLNADGKPDLAAANEASSTVSVLLGNGDGAFGTKTDFGTGAIPYSVAIGDLNGDGKPDLAVANYLAYTMSVLLGNGDGTFGAKTDFGTGASPISVAIGDLNGDGNPDLAVANYYSNTVSVLLNLGPGVTTAISVALEDVQTEVGVVRLRWVVPDAGDFCTVQRRNAGSEWVVLGLASFDRPGVVAYEDRLVEPGGRYAYRLFVQSSMDQEYSREVWVTVPRGMDAPLSLRLGPVYPNPFETETHFNFGIPSSGVVRLKIYDVAGRLVISLLDRELPSGWRSAAWDGRDRSGRPIPSGTYFAKVESSGQVRVRKILVAR